MKKICWLFITVFVGIMVSCAGGPRHQKAVQPERLVPELPPERVIPPPPENIMGEGQIPQEKMTAFLLQNNPWLEPDFAGNLTGFYIAEAALEGVNYDVAFVQMCLETGFLSYGNLVTPDMNNFAGLGATGIIGPDGKPEKGLVFPDPRTGVRAHVQHLKAYASTEPLNNELVNPRRRFVRLGCVPTIDGLAGTWASDLQYAHKLRLIMQRLYKFAFSE